MKPSKGTNYLSFVARKKLSYKKQLKNKLFVYLGVGSIRPNPDIRRNKNWTAENCEQTPKTEGLNITIRPKN